MASEAVAALVGLLCTIVSSVVTFFLTRRKYNTEVDSQQIQNMKDSFEVYKKMMEEALDSQKRRLEETIAFQDKKIDVLQKENDNLKNQFNQLQGQMINLLMGNNLAELQGKLAGFSGMTFNTKEED